MAKHETSTAVYAKIEGEDEAPSEVLCGGFSVAWVSARDPQKIVNEDGALIVDLGELGIVACAIDGMGGMAHGREAAAVTVECLKDALTGEPIDSVAALRSALVDGLEAANRRATNDLKGGGAVVVATMVSSRFVQTIHVGDSEAILMGQRGKLKFRTVAHSPVGYATKAGLLDEESALFHPDRHFVSNGIGLEGMHIQIGPRVPFAKLDTVAVCSDGITDNAYEREIVESLRSGPLLGSTTGLFNLCRARAVAANAGALRDDELGKSDDITLLVIRRRA